MTQSKFCSVEWTALTDGPFVWPLDPCREAQISSREVWQHMLPKLFWNMSLKICKVGLQFLFFTFHVWDLWICPIHGAFCIIGVIHFISSVLSCNISTQQHLISYGLFKQHFQLALVKRGSSCEIWALPFLYQIWKVRNKKAVPFGSQGNVKAVDNWACRAVLEAAYLAFVPRNIPFFTSLKQMMKQAACCRYGNQI